MMHPMTAEPGQPTLTDEQFLHRFVFPEEDRPLFTTAAWRGEYRWFRAANITPLEKYRIPAEWNRICATLLRSR
jgi:hypothetical protein